MTPDPTSLLSPNKQHLVQNSFLPPLLSSRVNTQPTMMAQLNRAMQVRQPENEMNVVSPHYTEEDDTLGGAGHTLESGQMGGFDLAGSGQSHLPTDTFKS